MAIRNIFQGSNPRLRMTAKPVREITPHVLEILDDMLETLRSAEGVGLAAPQVGVNRRLVVIEIEDQDPLELINPEIISQEGEEQRVEGCLSFPGQVGDVIRPTRVTVRALDRSGEERTYEGEGLLAQAFAHELDHLDGILFIDKVVRWRSDEEPDGEPDAPEEENGSGA
ncbi:MAG: peptide deformylase [Clostridia bacterium]|nr:peptide deformylase [Clostridia bacterium]